jgi:hypothetical protein
MGSDRQAVDGGIRVSLPTSTRAMVATHATPMTERERAEEKVRAIVEELDRPTLALLYRTLHDALGFRIETADIAIGKLTR